jgi:CRP-like cAMP-binding protein/formate hydrogenlyase subunit 6/NADH:ubiquinone oxidoreductase subunit I
MVEGQPPLDDVAATYIGAGEEALFARNFDGQLIRLVEATAEDFDRDVRLTIDGESITVKRAVPLRDVQGEIVRDQEGRPIPRSTTIYDAACQRFVREPGDQPPIPTVCHREHLKPVGVCRVCMVEASEGDSGRGRSRKALVPACVYRVSDGMSVHTAQSRADEQAASRVRDAVRMLLELLATDHLPSTSPSQSSEGRSTVEPESELAELCRRFEVPSDRLPARNPETRRGIDRTSEMIVVNHDACILCERCARSCSDVKQNYVIGRTGKGYLAGIGFDLNLPMGQSSCVSCGECAIACPTDALQFRPEVVELQKSKLDVPAGGEVLGAEEMQRIPIFAGIPRRFLEFNGGACVRRQLDKGEVLCREGDYGSTAFLILSGRFEVFLESGRKRVETTGRGGLWGWLGALQTSFRASTPMAAGADTTSKLKRGERIYCTPDDVIIGEMTCMNRYPRSATVVAVEPSEVLEIRRNVLYMLQRSQSSRAILDHLYRRRALNSQLERLSLLEPLKENERGEAASFLRDRAELIRVEPGQTIFRQGETGDDIYLVRLGFVKVTQRQGADQRVANYLGPGSFFGEIGALHRLVRDAESQLGGLDYRPSVRSATCSALDHVELVRIASDDLRALTEQFPQIGQHLLGRARKLLDADQKAMANLATQSAAFLEQGLFNAQSLLVLDLESCTRCDECTRACADTHEGVTRLVREGLRFERFLVASSCRACLDPYCLVGCPVDAIHRQGSMEIEIEDHCIGCGLCASNCPYGNINMHGQVESRQREGKRVDVVQQRATTCDLCRNVDGRPSCVYACPHNAAFRMSGSELLRLVQP